MHLYNLKNSNRAHDFDKIRQCCESLNMCLRHEFALDLSWSRVVGMGTMWFTLMFVRLNHAVLLTTLSFVDRHNVCSNQSHQLGVSFKVLVEL